MQRAILGQVNSIVAVGDWAVVEERPGSPNLLPAPWALGNEISRQKRLGLTPGGCLQRPLEPGPGGQSWGPPTPRLTPVCFFPRWLYEGLSREKAEELLLLPGNPGGAFLIRESQTRRGG